MAEERKTFEKENMFKKILVVCSKEIFDRQSVGISGGGKEKIWLLAQVECYVYNRINDCNYVEDGY